MATTYNRNRNHSKDTISFNSAVEAKEFSALVREIDGLGFTRSSEVSQYIVRNKLGQKYPHISGVVTMRAQGRDWEFVGGFPSHIYARLCQQLGLTSNGSYAQVVRFKPFSQIAA